ncbi:helix-turn-helix domain-containing protein [Nocardia mangyaensis]|uniref:helix-turn-helix domain-containing protein n=1 Tax=Nocardia mangyaensis TaxID=2213200 RepID=UPI002676C66A|nr:helix-turn-helix transcriptional regulator [Nocardia mangyaensis]MDO3648156.1 helix-turn-helix transcriptional regulator [Nocardia mangyaensis]
MADRSCADRAREQAEAAERSQVAEEVRQAVADSGVTNAEFAASIGTSGSRLSTYLSGKVVPSSTLMVRIRRVAEHYRSVA